MPTARSVLAGPEGCIGIWHVEALLRECSGFESLDQIKARDHETAAVLEAEEVARVLSTVPALSGAFAADLRLQLANATVHGNCQRGYGHKQPAHTSAQGGAKGWRDQEGDLPHSAAQFRHASGSDGSASAPDPVLPRS